MVRQRWHFPVVDIREDGYVKEKEKEKRTEGRAANH
jgi:hypothetical protein